jgi:small subunit ribosomal protein S21
MSLAYVTVHEEEPLERAMRRFRRKVQQEAILKDYKRNSVYLKPGDRKRMKERRARKRLSRYLRRRNQNAAG